MSRRITREAAASDTIKRCIFRGRFVFSSEESEKKYCRLSNQAYPDKHEAPSPFSFTRCCSTKAAAKFNPRRISLFSTLFFSLPYIFFFYALGLFSPSLPKVSLRKGNETNRETNFTSFFPVMFLPATFPFPHSRLLPQPQTSHIPTLLSISLGLRPGKQAEWASLSIS